MSKRIGILGGISYESTKNYYELIHKKYFEPNILFDIFSLQG